MFSRMKKKLIPGDVVGDEVCCYVFGASGGDGENDTYLSLASSKQQLMFDILALFDDIIESHNSKINGSNPYGFFDNDETNALYWDGMVTRYKKSLDELKLFRSNLEVNIDQHIASGKKENFFALDELNSFFLFVGMRPRQKVGGQYVE
ncbi:hypothetical protein BFS14_00125 [Serratia fonticola]|uniref:hypothetical protein n=1 Tax=Serratia fonticola TaxID=47917 RepID=UPI0008FCFEEC|nr:hypothetical protein [Serratia fonticola]OIX95907.1 hypothetical protein BFS14_00125 [Serratia fonticola]QCR61164.1 hypothetical protein FD644_12650 [Serratia fonticola]